MSAQRHCSCHAAPHWLACAAGRRSSGRPLPLQPPLYLLTDNTAEVGSELISDEPTLDVQYVWS